MQKEGKGAVGRHRGALSKHTAADRFTIDAVDLPSGRLKVQTKGVASNTSRCWLPKRNKGGSNHGRRGKRLVTNRQIA